MWLFVNRSVSIRDEHIFPFLFSLFFMHTDVVSNFGPSVVFFASTGDLFVSFAHYCPTCTVHTGFIYTVYTAYMYNMRIMHNPD